MRNFPATRRSARHQIGNSPPGGRLRWLNPAPGVAARISRSIAMVAIACAGSGILSSPLGAPTASAQESYPVHPDSVVNPDVPHGKVESYTFDNSKTYPGTHRQYFVYTPAQYEPGKPAALMVFQDGGGYVNEKGTWRVPVVFDNLIASGEMPVTIAVCVNPGVVSGQWKEESSDSGEQSAQNRFNRSLEYDTVSDRYATFLIDELLAEVGKKYSLTDDPNLRAIGGSSSGAIAAFGVAWNRPDQFRRVLSTVGTFVGLRGGNEYPTLIRKTEPKPLRVFLQDGKNDLDIYGGSWWNANLTMLSALRWAGYDVNNAWGDGGHNSKHGGAILPDALRWLWKDFDQPITTSITDHPELKDRIIQGEDWQLVSDGHQYTEGPAVSPDGVVHFVDGPRGEIWRVSKDGDSAEKWIDDMPGVSGLMFDAEGRLYCARNTAQTMTRVAPDGTRVDLFTGVSCNDLVVLDHGVYFSAPSEKAVYYLPLGSEDAKPIKVGDGPEKPNGLIVTPDKRFLLVVDAMGRYIWSYKIANDGSLLYGQSYSYVHSPQDEMNTGADGVTMTSDGSLLVATKLGVQVFDQPGRAHVILKRPKRGGRLSNLVFAGEDMQTIYATSGSSVFRRNTKMQGIAPWQPSLAPPKPRL
ncbi:enterobactin/ferric enterobactin esterase [Rubripirellula lacrimiformis]|uniref:Enterobactin/ferric enterobactin esterase n=1 Tax=Rubripirellula lacrimiformis TaxID=1930273 RepID=A0A517NDT3_9BACT|nr:SMP-30/gluconolactonase/LRE family protein [Rubripirellula lacrimiformis]QDT05291.1 enterobactin/ferric enterobactin esterase [Rubripirellula lacrimiformis]